MFISKSTHISGWSPLQCGCSWQCPVSNISCPNHHCCSSSLCLSLSGLIVKSFYHSCGRHSLLLHHSSHHIITMPCCSQPFLVSLLWLIDTLLSLSASHCQPCSCLNLQPSTERGYVQDPPSDSFSGRRSRPDIRLAARMLKPSRHVRLVGDKPRLCIPQ